MPTYSYRRPDGSVFDAFQRITDDALTEDPETGQPVVRVISGGAGLQFKGTGFYLTDYVKKSGTPDKTSDSPASSTGSSDATASAPKAEPKPAAPAPAASSTSSPSSD